MIGRRSLVAIVNVAIGAVLGLVALKVSALYFGKSFLGEAAGALAIFGILWVFSDLSMGEAHVKRVSEGMPVGDCFTTFAVFRIASTIAFVLVSVGGVFAYVNIFGRTLEDVTMASIVFAIAFYVFKSAQQIPQSTFEARLEAARSQVVSFVETAVRVALTLVFALAFAALARNGGPWLGRIDADNPVWSWVLSQPGGAIVAASAAGSIVAAFVAYGYLWQNIERGHFRWDILKSYLAFALPLFAISAVGVIAFFIDRVVLSIFGVAADTGDFEGPRRLVSVIEGVGAAVGFMLFPRISTLLAEGDSVRTVDTVNKSIRYLSLLTVPIVAFLAAFSGPVIRLTLDNSWFGSSSILVMLAFWVLMLNVSRPLATYLIGSNRPAVIARIGVLGALVHIVLNLILVPDDIKSLGISLFGMKAQGAAVASVLSGTVHVILMVVASRRILDYRVPWRPLVKHALAGALMALALLAFQGATAFELGRWYTFPPYLLLGGLVYLATLVALRELTREDWLYVQDTLHPGEMARYLKSELLRKGDKS